MVWGGRRLGEVLGKPLPAEGPHGESWELSDHAAHHSVVADGPWRGRTLRQLMQQEREHLLGRAAAGHETFPWLVKFLDAADWLSVQVHPSAEHVGRLWPGENSKTEAWFVLAAAPQGRIYAGLRPGVDERRLVAALRAGTVAECLHQFQPCPGDCVFLPAGTVHAVGGGVLMAEVQQTSDATFRLFDWDRVGPDGQRRRLHIEEALACIDWQAGPVHLVRPPGYPAGGERGQAGPTRQELVRCRHFALQYLREDSPFGVGGDGEVRVVVVVHGRGRLGNEPVRAGDTLLLPAAGPRVECLPEGGLGLLIASLPEAAGAR
jgi:mannose-6-phosphate isomerase